MTQEKALKKLADIIFYAAKSGYMPYDTNDEMCAMNIAKKHIDDFYPSLPSNLDEAAAFRLAASNYLNSLNGEDVYKNTQKVIIEAIRFGAEWMAGQGVSIDGKVIMDFSNPADIINRRLITKLGDSLLEIEPGDVVVKIRKK